MDSIVAISIALITAIGGILAALVQQGRKENSRDHAVVLNKLIEIDNKVDEVKQVTDGHLAWHSTI